MSRVAAPSVTLLCEAVRVADKCRPALATDPPRNNRLRTHRGSRPARRAWTQTVPLRVHGAATDPPGPGRPRGHLDCRPSPIAHPMTATTSPQRLSTPRPLLASAPPGGATRGSPPSSDAPGWPRSRPTTPTVRPLRPSHAAASGPALRCRCPPPTAARWCSTPGRSSNTTRATIPRVSNGLHWLGQWLLRFVLRTIRAFLAGVGVGGAAHGRHHPAVGHPFRARPGRHNDAQDMGCAGGAGPDAGRAGCLVAAR